MSRLTFEPHAKKIMGMPGFDPLTLLMIISLIVSVLRLWFEMRRQQGGPMAKAIMRIRAKSRIMGKLNHLPYRVRTYMASTVVDYLSNLSQEELESLESVASQESEA